MPAVIKLSIKELKDLIGKTERGQDAIELKKLLAKVEEEERLERPVRVERRPVVREEEATFERLNREAGYLFPEGLTPDILNMCSEYDLKYSLTELRKMCIEAGLSPSGHKKLLAAKLIAKGIK